MKKVIIGTQMIGLLAVGFLSSCQKAQTISNIPTERTDVLAKIQTLDSLVATRNLTNTTAARGMTNAEKVLSYGWADISGAATGSRIGGFFGIAGFAAGIVCGGAIGSIAKYVQNHPSKTRALVMPNNPFNAFQTNYEQTGFYHNAICNTIWESNDALPVDPRNLVDNYYDQFKGEVCRYYSIQPANFNFEINTFKQYLMQYTNAQDNQSRYNALLQYADQSTAKYIIEFFQKVETLGGNEDDINIAQQYLDLYIQKAGTEANLTSTQIETIKHSLTLGKYSLKLWEYNEQ